MSKKIRGSAAEAGAAAAEMAKETGASVDKQVEAAGRAAAAWKEMAASMTSAQKAAGDAAAKAARAVGASVDEQRTAYGKAIAAQHEYEDAQKQAAASAQVAADEQVAAAKRASAAQAAAAKASADAIEASAARAREAQKKFASFGGKVALGLTVGGGLSAYEGVKGAMQLQQQMERLHTQAQVSQPEIKPLTTGILNMAGQVGEGPGELSQGAYHVASQMNKMLQGLPQAKQMSTELNALKTAAEGAQIGGSDLVDTTNALGAAIVSGIKGVQNYRQAMGAMNATVGAGDMSMQQLAESFGTGVVVQAQEAGLSIKQLGGALAVLGDNNIRGAKAGTLMASALRIMKAPSDAAAKALASIGLSSTSLATALRSGGPIAALEELRQHLAAAGANINGTTDQMNKAGLVITRAFGGRQSAGVQDLVSQMGRLRTSTAEVGKGMGSFGADWGHQKQTMAQQVDDLKAHVAALGDEFGMYLIPKLEAVAHATSDVINWMKRHQAAAEALATVIGGVLGAAVAAYAFGKAVAFVGATKNMLSAIGGLAKGAASAATAIAAKLGLIGTTATATETEFAAAGEGMTASADATAAGVDTAIGSTGLGAVLIAAGLAATELATHWGTAMHAMEVAVNAMAKVAEHALNGLISALNWSIGIFNSTIGKLTGDIGRVGSVGVGNVFNTSGNKDANAVASALMAGRSSKTPSSFMGHNMMQAIPGFAMASGGSNWQKIASALSAQGYSKVAISGILGNFAQENGGNTVSGISTSIGPGGTGFAQWTGSRQTAEASYAKRYGLAPSNIEAEIGYLLQELKGPYANAAKAVNSATSPAQAAQEFEKIFEGASIPEMGHRINDANEAYRLLGGTVPSSGGGGGTSMPVNPGLASSLKKYLSQTSGSSSTRTKAAATSAIPVAVATMLKTAEALQGTKYVWGGGHSGWDPVAELKKIGLDCSGFVSQVLHAGGVSLPGPLTTSGLASNLQKGAGKYVTVYDRANGPEAHTFMNILGKWFMEGGNSAANPSGNVSQLTAAQAKTELQGGGFVAYHPTIPGGKDASKKEMAALGVSSTGTAASGTLNGVSVLQAAMAAIVKAHEAYLKKLTTSSTSLLKQLTDESQSGSVRMLERVLGVSTRGQTSQQIEEILSHIGISPKKGAISHALSPVLEGMATPADIAAGRRVVAAQRAAALARLDHEHLTKDQKAGDTIRIDKHYNELLRQHGLNAKQTSSPGERSFDKFISTLRDAHTKALTALADKLVVAHKQALVALSEELYAAQKTKDAESINLQATQAKDQTTMVANAAANALTIQKDQQQAATDAMSAQTTAIQNMTQIVTDRFSGMVQAVTDSTQQMSDAANATVQGINDQTQTQVDILGERGLYGLNLIAQRLQVQLDVQKGSDDRAIAVAQQNLDVVTMNEHAAESAAQLQVDQVQYASQAAAAMAQQAADQVAIVQTQKIAAAQAHSDTVQLKEDIAVQLAQTAVDLSATAPKAQQDKVNAQLALAQSRATLADQRAATNLQNVTDAANKAIQTAQSNAQNVTDASTQAVAAAQQTLATVTGQANYLIATAQQTLTGVQDTATTTEAKLQGQVSITGAEASTQFAGSGTVVNVYGVPVNNAAAIGDAVSWVARTQLQTA